MLYVESERVGAERCAPYGLKSGLYNGMLLRGACMKCFASLMLSAGRVRLTVCVVVDVVVVPHAPGVVCGMRGAEICAESCDICVACIISRVLAGKCSL